MDQPALEVHAQPPADRQNVRASGRPYRRLETRGVARCGPGRRTSSSTPGLWGPGHPTVSRAWNHPRSLPRRGRGRKRCDRATICGGRATRWDRSIGGPTRTPSETLARGCVRFCGVRVAHSESPLQNCRIRAPFRLSGSGSPLRFPGRSGSVVGRAPAVPSPPSSAKAFRSRDPRVLPWRVGWNDGRRTRVGSRDHGIQKEPP